MAEEAKPAPRKKGGKKRGRRGRRRRWRRGHFLLDHHTTLRPLPRPGVRVRALAADREPAPMPDAAIRADVHEPLHVHRHLAAQVTLDLELALDELADPV